MSNSIDLNLLEANKTLEFSSADDADLLNLICYATHEGVNLNGTEFTRQILFECYKSFEDKPLVVVPNMLGEPTGHGFDFVNRKFKNNERKVVGHIVESSLCMVNGEEVNFIDGIENPEDLDTLIGEMRVICRIVVYKHYMQDVAQMIVRLHNEHNLKFSMEGLMDADMTDDGIKHCTDIQFTGLAIVQNPAFEHSYSLDVAEEENENGGKMDYEKAYNELKAKYDALKAKYDALKGNKNTDDEQEDGSCGGGGGSTSTEKKKKKNSTAEVEFSVDKYEELLDKIATLTTTVAELTPYKEKVETAQKAELGLKRFETLKKLGNEDKNADELAEMSKDEYATLLEDTVASFEKETHEDKKKESLDEQSDVRGIQFHNSTPDSDIDSLKELLAEMTK